MRKPLNIFFKKTKVGTLEKKPDDTLEFRYGSDWLSFADKFALTPALPLQEEAFNNRLTKSYFDNLLPEGDTLKIFESILKKSFDDPYQLLEAYGLDCAGALEITPLDDPPEIFLNGNAEQISFEEIDRVLDNRQSLYVHTLTQHKGRFSLAGAQDKIPIVFKDGQILLPQDAAPTTHILKPPTRLSEAYESVVYNEWLCMQIAGRVGLPVPETKIIGQEHPLFLIARYDRKEVGGRIERIHQFDLCQAQGYPQGEKYEEDGGPSFDQNYHQVHAISDSKIRDLELCLRWLSFNLIIGNNDSHSKNLSFLFEEGRAELTPLYDLMSTAVYPNMTSQFAFSIGGQREWHLLKKVHFQKLAHKLGFEKREDILIETLLKEGSRIKEMALPFLDEFISEHRSSLVAQQLRGEIEKRSREFGRKLSS